MKKKTRMLLLILLALAFLGSGAMLLYRNYQYRQGMEIYNEAETLSGLPDFSLDVLPIQPPPEIPAPSPGEPPVQPPPPVYVDPYAKALRSMNFTALREVNPDVLGWILIPGTVISYPLVQGADNDYYLKRSWKKWNSVVGSIFLECQNSPDLSDFNTIIYGHRMNNGSMFAALKRYKTQSYWAAHPMVYLTDDGGAKAYEIFAAYEVSTQGETYRLGFKNDAAKQSFLDICTAQSVIATGVTPTVQDHILTLSTCTGNGHATRWVVQARLAASAETETPTTEMAPPTAETAPPAAEMAPPTAEMAPPTTETEAPTDPLSSPETMAEVRP